MTYALLRIIEVDPAQQIPFSKFEEVLEIKDSVLSDKRANELDEEFLNMNKPLHWEFEKVLDASEGTNFDYYVEMPKSHRVLFEVKYTEAKFSEEKPDETHIKKYLKFYRPKLSGIFKPEFLNQDTILKNYQIARNLSYIDEQTTVVFLFPEQNEKLNATENFINSVVYQDKLKHIRIIYLEHFIEQLLQSEYLLSKHKIFEEFKAKYIT